MPRKVHLESGIILTTRFNSAIGNNYFELVIQQFEPADADRNIRCKLVEKNPLGAVQRQEVFKGKFRRKLDDTRIVAVLYETDFGLAKMRLVINANEHHSLKDRIRIQPEPGKLLDNIEKFGAIEVPTSGTMDDPDVEGFQRVNPTSTNPLGSGTSTTGNVPGRLQQGTVVIKNSIGVPYAYDDPTQSPNLRLYIGGGAFGTVVYNSGGNWNITSTDATFPGGTIEALMFS